MTGGSMRLITAARDIELREGDVLLLETEQQVARDQAEMLKNRVRQTFPGCEAVILAAGMHLGAVLEDAGTPIYDAVMALHAQ